MTDPEYEAARRSFELDFLVEWGKECDRLALGSEVEQDEQELRTMFGLLLDGVDEDVVTALLRKLLGSAEEIASEETRYPLPTQAQTLEWRRRKGLRADLDGVTMKLAEESGEVVAAVVKIGEGRSTQDNLALELAQTVICCMAVAEAAEIDLDSAIRGYWYAQGGSMFREED